MKTQNRLNRRKLLKSIGALTLGVPTLAALPVKASASEIPNLNKANIDETQNRPPSSDYGAGKIFTPGYLTIIQGPSTDSTVMINFFIPKLKKYFYEVIDNEKRNYQVVHYRRLEGPTHFHVAKLKITGLTPNTRYTLNIYDTDRSGGKTNLVDQRFFKSLDITKTIPKFAFLSCMSDDYKFDQVIGPMWNRLREQDPDFLILSGDLVYVDSFENVERDKATEFDVWQRYIDAMRKIPVYHWLELKPILATWDDHDYGTNDGDRNFVSKEAVNKLFHALFYSPDIDDTWTLGPQGSSGLFQAFGQKFFLMDDRSFRQPNKESNNSEPFGHWGEDQHKWLFYHLSKDSRPAWVINGNQFFRGAPADLKISIESLQFNHPNEFRNFCEGLKQINAPVVFGSGDVHLSEVMEISSDKIGYKSFEFTASSMHSYTGKSPWKNELRIPELVTVEFNFMIIKSEAIAVTNQSKLMIEMQSMGLDKVPYFAKKFEVVR